MLADYLKMNMRQQDWPKKITLNPNELLNKINGDLLDLLGDEKIESIAHSSR